MNFYILLNALAITVAHFLTGDLSNRQRIESSSTHGKKINYSNDYSETSSSASSSSFDSSYNQAAKAQANSAGYKGEAGSATGSFLYVPLYFFLFSGNLYCDFINIVST